MNKYDLSVLIPARNEMFLKNTVENILANKRGRTEVLVGLDGAWADPGLEDHPDLTIIYSPVSLGQRGMTNQLCRLSKAKYVMKIDAHCAVDEGFDVKMMEEMDDDVTLLPAMYNLHGFDGKCKKCGKTWYQSPTPTFCHKEYEGGNDINTNKNPDCDNTSEFEKIIVFKPRMHKRSEFFRFDLDLHFQYHGLRKSHPDAQGQVAETMSAQGSCFMLTREKYWELDICDEGHGSWGQQGVEVACKTWLSGGRLMVNKKTWYSHLFRTQGGDFGFPYPLSGKEVDHARNYSKDMWFYNKFKKQIRPLSWLINKFKPLPDWHDEKGKQVLAKVEREGEVFYKKRTGAKTVIAKSGQTKEIIFYTDNQLKLRYAHAVQRQLKSIGLPITSVSLKPMPHFGNNIHLPLKRGIETYFTQIITALETSKADIVYMCEHDVLYHPSHFDFTPPTKDKFYYNQNVWRIRPEVDDFAVHWDANQVAELVCYRELLLDWYKKKWITIQLAGFDRSYEPGGRDTNQYETFNSEYPNIDIRHGGNLTKSKWSKKDFRDKSTCVNWQESTIDKIPGWGNSLASL